MVSFQKHFGREGVKVLKILKLSVTCQKLYFNSLLKKNGDNFKQLKRRFFVHNSKNKF